VTKKQLIKHRQLRAEAKKEAQEHPWASKRTAMKIAKDHARKKR